MAIKSTSGFMVEETPESISTQSLNQGTGTPITPAGGNVVSGATSKQKDMIGTPAQQQNAQEQRRLSEVQRYEPPKPAQPTAADQAAKDKAETLSNLGPVRTQVQGLIEQRIANMQTSNAEVQINEAKIESLPPELQGPARDALNAYIVAKQNQDPTAEEKLQAFYNTLDEATRGTIGEGGMAGYLMSADESIQAAAQGALQGTVTLGQLDLGQINVDLGQLEQALGLEPGAAANLTLDQLDAAIDAVEAQELNRVDQIRAQLADPNLPPAMRQQLMQQLGELSAAGITGAEASVEELDAAIAAGQTVNIAGQEFSLEDALSDEGISATIARAVANPEALQDLREIPGYEDLANWIESNKATLEGLVGEISQEATDFLDLQDEYENLKNSFGADNVQLVADTLGIDLTADNITSAEWAKIQEVLNDPDKKALYEFYSDEENAQIVNEVKDDPVLKAMLDGLLGAKEENGEASFDSDDISEIMKTMTTLDTNELYDSVLGNPQLGSEEYPATRAGWEKLQADIKLLSDHDAEIKSLEDWLTGDNPQLDLDDLRDIFESDYADDIVGSITQLAADEDAFDLALRKADDVSAFLREQILGPGVHSVKDIEIFMKANPKAAEMIKAVFDDNGDGKIDANELKTPDEQAAREALGFTTDPKSIIDADGRWSQPKVTPAPAGEWRNQVITQIGKKYNELWPKATKTSERYNTILEDHLKAMGVTDFKNYKESLRIAERAAPRVQKYQAAKQERDKAKTEMERLKAEYERIGREQGMGEAYTIAQKQYQQALKQYRAHNRTVDALKKTADKYLEGSGMSPDSYLVNKKTLKQLKKLEDKISKHNKYVSGLKKLGGNLEDLSDEELEQLLG